MNALSPLKYYQEKEIVWSPPPHSNPHKAANQIQVIYTQISFSLVQPTLICKIEKKEQLSNTVQHSRVRNM